jgi:hypothetical protein
MIVDEAGREARLSSIAPAVSAPSRKATIAAPVGASSFSAVTVISEWKEHGSGRWIG